MVKRVLIANRGEIVARIIRTCKEMGIATAVVYSEADANMPYIETADDAVLIGPANPVQSYLNIDAIIDAARKTGAQAVHPGYGFLSERGAFAEAVEAAGITWVGPPPQVLRSISSKSYCREIADSVNVPVIPGTLGIVESPAAVIDFGNANGWPVFLNLDKGGGGKGIERVGGAKDAAAVFERATRIGKMAFGSGACYIETVVDSPRHIEVQFLADRFGNCVCLGERSVQSSGGIRRSLKRRPRWWLHPMNGRSFSNERCGSSPRSATGEPVRWNTCARATATTTSWRSTLVFR